MDLAKIRDIGIIAHIDAGKTTLTERMLFYSGCEHRMGDVDHGNTVTDFDDEERERGITILSAAVSFDWEGHRVNLIDTPGHVDFTAEVERSLRVLDGAIGVFSGVEGVEAQSETVWRQADRYSVPRIAFVNKLDRTGADFKRTVQSLRDRLGAPAVSLTIPIGLESEFEGIVDIIRRKALRFTAESEGREIVEDDVPDDLVEEMEAARTELIEAAADFDDDVMARYLEGEDIPNDDLRAAIRRGTLAGRMVPTLCGTALRNQGVQPVLDAVLAYLPSPLDAGDIEGLDPKREERVEIRKPDPKAPFCALAFKTTNDRHGELIWMRVYSGTIRKGQQVQNPRNGKAERLARIVRLYADRREEIDSVSVGDIVATIGPRFTSTGDTLCEKKHPILLERVVFPETVVSLAIEPASSADRDALTAALGKMARDDPTFESRMDPDTGQVLIHGMGELHLEVLVHRLVRDYGVKANVGRPRVAYKQTIAGRVEAEGKFIRAAGQTRGHFGHVVLRVEPHEGRERVTFGSAASPDDIPNAFVPAIEASVRSAAESGVGLGFPVVNVRITLIGGSQQMDDSSEMAYEAAASIALDHAFNKAGAVLLEPVMRIEIRVPAHHMGDVLADLQRRRCDISGMEEVEGLRVIRGIVPLERMFGYSTLLRSLTQGRGTFSMEPCAYGPVPPGDVERLGF
jgi:elongation factor G